jgi:hypothetical protein
MAVTVEVLSMNANAGTHFGADFAVYEEEYWPELFRTRPDAAGNFVIHHVPGAGNIYLAATAPGLAEAQFTTTTPATVKSVALRLPLEGVIEGMLRSGPELQPRPDVFIYARTWESNAVSHHYPGSVNANGSFRITGLPSGSFSVTAQPRSNPAPWTSTPINNVLVQAGQTTPDVEVWLETGALLAGTVIDAATGEPLAESRLEAKSPAEGFGESVASTLTDELGRFELRLPQGDLQLVCGKDGYNYATETINVPQQSATLAPHHFRLSALTTPQKPQARTTVKGRVVDPQGKGMAGVTIIDQPISRINEDGSIHGGFRLGLTDRNGHYQVEVNAQGQRRIQAGGGPHSTQGSLWFSPRPEETIEMPDLVVTSFTNDLSGVVVDETGAPWEGLRVRVTAQDFEWINLLPRTDAEGRFYLDHLPDYEVEVCISDEARTMKCQTLLPGGDYEFVVRRPNP